MWVIASVRRAPCGPADDDEDEGPEAKGAGPAPMRNDSRITSTNDDGFRRLEVITGVGRRRRWTDEEKVWIVAESLDPATTVSAVARRYGLHPSQLFVWRQQLAAPAAGGAPGFVPVVVAEDDPAPAGMAGRIEIVLGPAVVRVGADVDAAALPRGLEGVRGLA